MGWTTTDKLNAVAIYNYQEQGPYRLDLLVGDVVKIQEENDDWYYGSRNNKNKHGIFPKSYVHILTESRNEPLMQEITSVLREWGFHWKRLFGKNQENFLKIRTQILDLINSRCKILSGTLTVDELKDMKRLATARIDTGNYLLGLDMVVRDEDGNILNSEHTSAMQLYYNHEKAAARIKKATNEIQNTPIKSQAPVYSYTFFLSVRNFICKTMEDVELLLQLYDAKEQKAITENYVVSWTKEGLTRDIDQIHNLRVLFSDLGTRDLTRERVYLVCYIIRIGSLETKDNDHKRLSIVQNSNQKTKTTTTTETMRRPFGVAAMDISIYMSGTVEADIDHHEGIPFHQCSEKENLDETLRRILAQKETETMKNKNAGTGGGMVAGGGQGLWISFKLLKGSIKQVREEYPHLVLGNVAIARKMGFPEVILPGDVRNDLYLCLAQGDFSKSSKSTDKNIEVTVKVCNEQGFVIPGVITTGSGVTSMDEYHSIVYHRDEKPKWFETFKIAIPIEEFKQAHIKFTFKQRSSNEVKDKLEKPFAMSYVRLMQKNGTTLQDTNHELLVYKIDQKRYDENDTTYFQLPSSRAEFIELNMEKKLTKNALTLSAKDNFLISINVCSTKLTQNIDLLGLLNWSSTPMNLKQSLIALMNVDGEEVVKFLQDVLDALFNILMSNSDCDDYDDMVFECILYIISLVSDRKYQHFQPILDLYISKSFSATLAYKKLIVVLRKRIDSASSQSISGYDRDMLLKTMKNLQYCMRFIVQSRLLFTELDQDEEEFSQTLTELLESIVDMMRHETDATLLVQGACLKYFPTTIPHLLRVYSAKQLSKILTELLTTLPPGRLTKQKMMTVHDIVHSPLFLNADCRGILLPRIIILVRDLLEANEEGLASTPGRSVLKVAKLLGENRHRLNQHRGYSEEVKLCVEILSDILELTFRKDVGPTVSDIKEIMLISLRTIIQTVISMDRENPLVGNLVSVMLSIFRQMTLQHYNLYINQFATQIDRLDFLMEILMGFKDLVSNNVFPQDWIEMIMLQNSVILKCLRYFSGTIRDFFFLDFVKQVWSNFFHCAIAFLTQPPLQLETFTPDKRDRIVSRYHDMRRETAFEFRSMWFNLGQHKIIFVPSLVGPILEMALIPAEELQKATIPIFFDMMQCEFYSSRIVEGYGDTKRDPANIKGNFNEYENEMIAQLDILVEGGRGDEKFVPLWLQQMRELCKGHSTMHAQGLKFVDTVAKLMEHLLQYRDIINTECHEHRMICTVNLLEFYSEINRKEMYIRYVNKLCELHLECDNYTEAAYTLKLHSQLLDWSDQPLPPLLHSNRYPNCQTHRELKEALYDDIIEYFDKGHMWECALPICKELVVQYEEETYDYLQLAALLTRMSRYYESIVQPPRPAPGYFRVAYYGRGHPPFLQNKIFIYRGKEFERLIDFCPRTLSQMPNAELMNTLSPPSIELMESNHQYVQINAVEPLMDEKRNRLSGKLITAQAVLNYHEVNDVQKFRFSRPMPKKDLPPILKASKSLGNLEKNDINDNGGNTEQQKSSDDLSSNEFASLWLERTVMITSNPLPGILRCFPVISSDTFSISPLQNAIETMHKTNIKLRNTIITHRTEQHSQLNKLSMLIQGIVDPAVMGGINNYEKAFLNTDYKERHPHEASDLLKLESLIAEQIPLLGVGLMVHKARAPAELLAFHQHLEHSYSLMKADVEKKYGQRTCDLQIHALTQTVVMRKNKHKKENVDRLSDTTENSSTRSHILSSLSIQVGGGTNKKKDSKRRNSRKSEVISKETKEQPTSQWYTTPDLSVSSKSSSSLNISSAPVFELRQELTASRPLRSEIEKEKRLSNNNNRWSGQSQSFSLRNVNLNGYDTMDARRSNRDSIATTDSNASEDDSPPPLPLKMRESDSSHINQDESPTTSCCFTDDFELDTKTKPPTPPPKPIRSSVVNNKFIMAAMTQDNYEDSTA